MVLLIEYFVPQNEERHKEYLKCLEENINNQFITNIEIFVESDIKAPIESDKINYNINPQRPSFQKLFEFCNEKYPNQICIIANSDIMFDNTLSVINEHNMQNKFVALNRWDIKPNGNVEQFRHMIGDSQDTWIFKTPINIKGADFTMGRLGCDNRITYLAHESGMLVTNPSGQIRTKHLHNTEYRTISKNQSETVFGWHLLVRSNNNINMPSVIAKRNWPKR